MGISLNKTLDGIADVAVVAVVAVVADIPDILDVKGLICNVAIIPGLCLEPKSAKDL